LWRKASPLAAPRAIIILVAHDKGTVASGSIRKSHINKLKKHPKKKNLSFITVSFGIYFSQLILNKKSEFIVQDDLSFVMK